jgi:DNA-binding HxlR family transcriptional regulator
MDMEMDMATPANAPSTQHCTDGACAMGSLLRVLAGPWTLHIVWILTSEGPTRFGALRQKIAGISAKVLTERLRLLEKEGFVHRQYEAVIPPKVTYAPTARMHELSPILCRLNQLAASWYGSDGTPAHPPLIP